MSGGGTISLAISLSQNEMTLFSVALVKIPHAHSARGVLLGNPLVNSAERDWKEQSPSVMRAAEKGQSMIDAMLSSGHLVLFLKNGRVAWNAMVMGGGGVFGKGVRCNSQCFLPACWRGMLKMSLKWV